MLIHNSLINIRELFLEGEFSLSLWRRYINELIPDSANVFIEDSKDYDFTLDCLLHIQNVLWKSQELAEAVLSFEHVTEGLEERLLTLFGKSVDVEIILYLGLCNGAGWATSFHDQSMILLGIEKILELGWHDLDSMTGLIYHELGHIYQEQNGVLERDSGSPRDRLLWQLFIEGIAMVFEQKLVGDEDYYHQDRDGWKAFMAENLAQLKQDFSKHLLCYGDEVPAFFGDWTDYHGYGDAGYYLGSQFIRFLLKKHEFHELLSFEMEQVWDGYKDFLEN